MMNQKIINGPQQVDVTLCHISTHNEHCSTPGRQWNGNSFLAICVIVMWTQMTMEHYHSYYL